MGKLTWTIVIKGYDVGKSVVKLTKSMIFLELPLHIIFSFSLCSVRESEFLVFERESYYLETSRALPHTQD